jgi:hypothetical protein
MPKQLLTGTLDEQCDFLYNVAQEKIAQGNYTGAAYALKEIVKHVPNYKDAAELLAEVKARKSVQTRLLLFGMIGAALFVGLGTLVQVPNDLVFIGLALVGLVIGYGVGNWIESLRTTRRTLSARQD